MEALKQQWPDHELLVCDGDRKRDRDRKMRALNQTATESAWNANKSRDAWEQASWDEAGSWEAEDDQFEGSFADEVEEEAFNPAGTQLNEALASEKTREERLHKREQSCMTSRVVVVAINRKVQTRKVQVQERAKVKEKARTETVMAEGQDIRRTRRRVKLERDLTSRCIQWRDRA